MEPKYNGSSIKPSYTFAGPIADVDSTITPGNHRSGDESRRHFSTVSSEFTKLYDRWKESGQNYPYVDGFLPTRGHTTALSALGRNLLILFQVLRSGKSDERKDFLRYTVWTMHRSNGRQT